MNLHRIADYLKCLNCSSQSFSFIEAPSHKPDSGLFICQNCGEFYSLKQGILDARPNDLYDASEKQILEREYKEIMQKKQDTTIKNKVFQRKPEEQFMFEEAVPESYDQQLLNTPFWQQVENKTLHTWPNFIRQYISEGVILDAGCGTGRVSNYLAANNIEVIAFDVTLSMLQIARRKAIEMGVANKVFYVLADIYHLPFRNSVFSGLSFFGVFHHLKSPALAFERSLDCLASTAVVCGMDNNNSAFRSLFNWSMKWKPLWEEDKMPYQLPSIKKIMKLLKARKFHVFCKTTCFIPPHLYQFLLASAASFIYKTADALFSCLPWFNRQGGLFTCKAFRET